MNLIQPAEISGKIMTLIDESKDSFIIVSPYNKITNWKKLTERIKKAKERGVEIKWYIRKGVPGNYEQIQDIGLIPIEIENLHCKMYLNEKEAVVTSMNLHEFSDSSSIDIGYHISEKIRYDELIQFIKTHIDIPLQHLPSDSINLNTSANPKNSFNDLLLNLLKNYSSLYLQLVEKHNKYGSQFELTKFKENYRLIFEPHSNYLRIDLRIELPFKAKQQTYYLLESRTQILEKISGEQIDFGSEMKRLKINLSTPNDKVYSDLNSSDFELFKPRIKKVIEMYLVELK